MHFITALNPRIPVIAALLLAGCSSTPINAPTQILTITQTIDIPDGSTHARFANGRRGDAGRYQPYCRLDLKAPLRGAKQVTAGEYTITTVRRHYVEDDLSRMPLNLWSRFGINRNNPFIDGEPIWAMLHIGLSGTNPQVKTLTCYQEHPGYFEATPFEMEAFRRAAGDLLSLTAYFP